MIYGFAFGDFEVGDFIAVRYRDGTAVSGDWVCVASNDDEALAAARTASQVEWAAPETRHPRNFVVTFVDSTNLAKRGAK